MRNNVTILGLVIVIIFILWSFKDMKLPSIKLPKDAHHNTIGELPIVEMADDGVFAEVDGAEEGLRWQPRGKQVLINQCQYSLEGEEEENCIRDVMNLRYNGGIPYCAEADKVAIKYNISLCFTCWGSFQ